MYVWGWDVGTQVDIDRLLVRLYKSSEYETYRFQIEPEYDSWRDTHSESFSIFCALKNARQAGLPSPRKLNAIGNYY